MLALAMPAAGLRADETLQLRVAWGGGAARQWQGTVQLSAGAIRGYMPLGVEADEPGSMRLGPEGLAIAQRGPRTYDGVDLDLEAPLDARLIVRLAARDAPADSTPLKAEILLRDLVANYFQGQLDERQNRLLVRRTSGDMLRLELPDVGPLIFPAGSTLRAALQPHLLPVEAGTTVRFAVELRAARGGRVLWSTEQRLTLDRTSLRWPKVPLEIPLPDSEGVYDLRVEANEASLRTRLGWKQQVAARKIQLVVLQGGETSSATATAAVGAPAAANTAWNVVGEIDPAGSSWWKRVTEIPLPWLRTGPLSSGHARVREHALGRLTELPAGRGEAFEAYPLPVSEPGRPHLLEVDVPDDVRQSLGISIVEPNAAGAVVPIGLDSGVEVVARQPRRDPQWITHRLVFWPRTKTPLVLLTNRAASAPAVYGKVRVLSAGAHLGPAPGPVHDPTLRQCWAYWHKPLVAENFGASDDLDAWSRRSLDDWQTFYEAGTRLVEYLRHLGYSGAMLCVAADGGALYPSQRLQPTPRYDTGVFFDSSQDLQKKDVLELWLRMFDREGLQLVPALDLAAPLPELEELLAAGDSEATGIQWVGDDGRTYTQRYPPRRGLAPYYNILDPRVQGAVLRVVRELVARAGHHPSFAGVALELSADGYLQLPGAAWGLDDATIERFRQETGIAVPGEGPQRFARRAEFLLEQQRDAWLRWRAEALAGFFRAVQQEISAASPGARLFLLGGRMLDRPDLQSRLRPTLPPQRQRLDEVLLELGIDVETLARDENLVLLRPYVIDTQQGLDGQTPDWELEHAPELDARFRGSSQAGVLFFHRPQELRLEAFDRASPFRDSFTWLVAQALPAAEANRRRFAHALAAHDARLLVDGGWLLPLGQEDAVRDMLRTIRALPAIAFANVPGSSPPLVVRSAAHYDRTYVYAVNTTPYPARLTLRVQCPPRCAWKTLGASTAPGTVQHDVAGGTLRMEIAAYGVVAGWLAAPQVALLEPQVRWDDDLTAALHERINDLAERTAVLGRLPRPLPLANAGFDEPDGEGRHIPAWQLAHEAGASASRETQQPFAGPACVRFATSDAPATLRSASLSVPRSGRLAISVRLRVNDPARQPPLRIALEGQLHGQPYYRYAPVGQDAGGVRVEAQWAQYIFAVNDLPTEGLGDLRVRFDLLARGEVWIDDVQVYDLLFRRHELLELGKLITLARGKLDQGQVGDCLRLLDGYWPHFLTVHVPRPASDDATPAQGPPNQRTATPGKIIDRLRGSVPDWLRLY